jgi:hypothetical protein
MAAVESNGAVWPKRPFLGAMATGGVRWKSDGSDSGLLTANRTLHAWRSWVAAKQLLVGVSLRINYILLTRSPLAYAL